MRSVQRAAWKGNVHHESSAWPFHEHFTFITYPAFDICIQHPQTEAKAERKNPNKSVPHGRLHPIFHHHNGTPYDTSVGSVRPSR